MHSGVSDETVKARCQNSPYRCSECVHLTPCPEPKPMSIGPQAARNAGKVPMYDCGVPPPPKLAATRG